MAGRDPLEWPTRGDVVVDTDEYPKAGVTPEATPQATWSERLKKHRPCINWWGGAAAVAFAVVSILAAINPHSKLWSLLDHQGWGKLIVGIWAVAPPAFFWLDWVYFVRDDDREIAKHTHDLARNIWLGLLGVISFAFFGIPKFG